MMRITRLAAALGAFTVALAVGACGDDSTGAGDGGAAKGIVAKAASQKKLVFGVKNDQPGLGLQTGATYSGFDIEIAKIIAKGLGLDPATGIEWKTTVSANREPYIQQGQVDVVVATYTINDERKKVVNFAGPYYVAGQDLLVTTASTIAGPEGLADKNVCSVTGSTPAKRIKTDYPKAHLQEFDAYSKCIQALGTGSVDAVTTDDIILAGYAAQKENEGKFKVVGKPFSSEPYGIGLKKTDTEGCNKINEILKASASDGSYKAAWDASLGASGKPAPELDVTKLTNCS